MKIIIIILILIIGGGVAVVGFAGQLEKIGCGFFPEGKTKDHCYQDAAVRLESPKDCYLVKGYDWDNVVGNPPQSKCFRRIAEKLKDPSVCDYIQNTHPNAETSTECYELVAIAAGNSAYCDLIETNISRGFGMFLTSRESCYTRVGSAPRYCEGKSGKELKECWEKEAARLKNLAVCEKAPKEEQQMCVLGAVALLYESQDFKREMCTVFIDSQLKYHCAVMAATLLEDKEACGMILEKNWKDFCLLMGKMGESEIEENYSKGDLEKYSKQCEQFSGIGRGLCWMMLGQEYCSIGRDSETREKDILRDGVELTIKGCLELKRDDLTGFCILMLSDLKPEFCPSYSGKTKDFCYEMAAWDNGDCSDIEDKEMKSDCKNNVIDMYEMQEDKCQDQKDIAECKRMFKGWVALKAAGMKPLDEMVKLFGN